MKIIRSAVFKLRPNKYQQQMLEQHFGNVRFVYNTILYKIKNFEYGYYEKNPEYPKIPSQFELIKEITNLKKQYDFLYLTPNDYLQATIKNLYSEFKGFYKGGGYPKFKKKKHRQTLNMYAGSRIKIDDKYIYLPKTKLEKDPNKLKIRYRKHKIKWNIDKILTYTIIKDTDNKYYLAITFETEHQPLFNNDFKPIGIDLGLKSLLITSEGWYIENFKFFKKSERRLKLAQRRLSRKKKGSNNWEKQRIKVAKIHKKIKNQRNWINHNISRYLVNNYTFIALESLQIKNMVKNKRLSKAISDVAWGDLISKIKYKSDENQVTLVQIDKFYPSSKTCHKCGYIKKDLQLSDRIFKCDNCGLEIDRDYNAAINILKKGLRIKGFSKDFYNLLGLNTPEFMPVEDTMYPKKQESLNNRSCINLYKII